MATDSGADFAPPPGTRVSCRLCDLSLDPIPAKHHFLGQRHEQACVREKELADRHHANQDFTRALCWECGTWCTSQQDLREHQLGFPHKLRLAWLGRTIGPAGWGNALPMRPVSPAPSSIGNAGSPEQEEVAAAAPAADAQPACRPPVPRNVQQQMRSLAGSKLRCRVCDWTGHGRDAWDHFRGDAHKRAAAPSAAHSKVGCVSCGIWCTSLRDLERRHYKSATHQLRSRWLSGPPPPSAGPGGAPLAEVQLPTMLRVQPSTRKRPAQDQPARPTKRMCTSSAGPGILAELKQQLLCPISHGVVVDPVTIEDGSSYERRSIEKWFRQHKTSPATGLAVDTRVLVPNGMMRAAAALYHHHKGPTSS